MIGIIMRTRGTLQRTSEEQTMTELRKKHAIPMAALALVALAFVGFGVANLGGIAYGVGLIDGGTAGALGLGTAGGASIVTGLEMAGVIAASTAGWGLVAIGGVAL